MRCPCLLTKENLNSFLRTSAVAEVRKRDNPITPTQNKKDRPSFEHPVGDRGRFERSYELPLSRKLGSGTTPSLRHKTKKTVRLSNIPRATGEDLNSFLRTSAIAEVQKNCRNIPHIMHFLIGFPDLLAAILPAEVGQPSHSDQKQKDRHRRSSFCFWSE